MTFQQRYEAAALFELVVMDAFKQSGMESAPYGQGVLAPETRSIVARYRTSLRWNPDLLVDARNSLWAVDAKWTTRTDTGNHDVELAATEAQLDFQATHGTVGVYAFNHADGRIGLETLDNWATRTNAWHPTWSGNGSGTPYKVAPCECVFPEWLTQTQLVTA